ncbi:MAG: hypothetical protein A2Y77_16005 [Planctomycetes bacterium RBG_13_62_9]|nr:MAG: hypothetical protein A2Y77_16005 [Planctomycetes bacterium RBG_13_62_9]
MPRDIQDILHFRSDISPFLVHLTRDGDGVDNSSAKAKLERIIRDRKLIPGEREISDVRFGGTTSNMSAPDRKKYFGAVCFTETPLNEVHCLLEINGRGIDLSPYGLVFVKEALRKKGVCPVCYINNERKDMDGVFKALFSLTDSLPDDAAKLLPLFAVFGQKIQAPGVPTRPEGTIDFVWEREWRYPSVCGDLAFSDADVFVGLCPHDEINDFEGRFPGIGFIDPQRNMKWYATKLIGARQRFGLKFSVV